MSYQSITITGGAGSLGKEFVRLLYKDYEITVVDNSEWAVAELKHEFPDIHVELRDFDHHKVDTDIIIHCAAYKHVNLGETNVSSFIQNNLIKTMRFYSINRGKPILYISTDKAVEPISAYGATKMLAEHLTKEYAGAIARCGNFIGSSGSVIPVWEKCIAERKPIPVTDEHMVRWVNEMEPAVKDIWTKFQLGEQLIISSGRRVTVRELLEETLNIHGFESIEDYAPGIVNIGKRPGEKMAEKLRWDWE